MKRRIAEISVCISLVVSMIFSVIDFNESCEKVRSDVLRLHILANSDTEEDQMVKLAVRDALLSCGKELFSGQTDLESVERTIKNEKNELIAVADNVLKSNGFEYKTQIYLTEEYFTTRTYGEYTLPAGNYSAIKVVLGEGNGHNWWCVMFPPLCIPAATQNDDFDIYFDKKTSDVIKNDSKFEIKFKIIEIIEDIKNKINYNNI
ncbi:MAG: stage II sporulation protein R [Clostridia bacterium]|nr:stage II sporulation protein R [Clostridia bacterium]